MGVMTLDDNMPILLMVSNCGIVVNTDIVVPVTTTGATVGADAVAARELPSFGCSLVTGNVESFLLMLKAFY